MKAVCGWPSDGGEVFPSAALQEVRAPYASRYTFRPERCSPDGGFYKLHASATLLFLLGPLASPGSSLTQTSVACLSSCQIPAKGGMREKASPSRY